VNIPSLVYIDHLVYELYGQMEEEIEEYSLKLWPGRDFPKG
jgi:hypothetical protein